MMDYGGDDGGVEREDWEGEGAKGVPFRGGLFTHYFT